MRKTSSRGRVPVRGNWPIASERIVDVGPPARASPSTNSTPRRRPASSAAIRPLSISRVSPEKAMMLKRSAGRSPRTPKTSARRAFSIFPASSIEPLTSNTNTTSLAGYSRRAASSLGDRSRRK